MYKAIDLRDEEFTTISQICDRIYYFKTVYPEINSIIISISQRQTLVDSDPFLSAASSDLSQKFEKPSEELDFKLILQGCRVEVE